MSQTDTSNQVSARVAAPIVLVIAANEAQTYLENNEVLQAIYGDQKPLRIVAGDRLTGVPGELFYPNSDMPECRLALLERFADVPSGKMAEFIKSDRFYNAIFHEILLMIGTQSFDQQQVRVIIAYAEMLAEGLPLREVIKRYFPEAAAFTVEFNSARVPKRLSLE